MKRTTTAALLASLLVACLLPAAVSLHAQEVEEQPKQPKAAPRGSDKAQLTRLQGTARIDRHNRVVGAVIKVRPEGDATRLAITSTDEDGVFRVTGLPNGEYRVSLERSGFVTVIKDRVIVKFPFRSVVEVTMEPDTDPSPTPAIATAPAGEAPITIRGLVVEREGAEAVSEVRVRFVHPQGALDPRTAQSDDAGEFVVSDLPPGEWRIEVSGAGYLPLRTRIDLPRDMAIGIALVQQPADYVPSPMELMPKEKLTPPPDFPGRG